MKLLCVIPSYYPALQYGGPITSVHTLNRVLVKRGVDVTVYTTNVGLEGKVSVNQEVNIDGVRVTYFAFTAFFESLSATGWQFSWQLARALKNNLKVFDVIYIVAIWNYPVTVAAHYCRKYKKPYIISPRGLLYPYTSGKKSWKKLPYYYLVAKRGLEGATAIHYTTKDEAERCHASLGLKNQTIIIPNGIDMSEFKVLPTKESLRERYPTLKDKKIILFLGRINWKKGMDILSKAYGKLAKVRDDVHLLIVGNDENNYEKKVRGWLEDEGILDRVTFTGMLTGEEKLETFCGSDIFVLPSYSENFGMAVIEAMACGIPIIISNRVGVHREVERSKAGLVIRPDSGELYNAMANLLDGRGNFLRMKERAKRLVEERFSIERIVDKMIEVFGEIINGNQ
jgi:glycosyltransferase involved in cell wall biosynthesis